MVHICNLSIHLGAGGRRTRSSRLSWATRKILFKFKISLGDMKLCLKETNKQTMTRTKTKNHKATNKVYLEFQSCHKP